MYRKLLPGGSLTSRLLTIDVTGEGLVEHFGEEFSHMIWKDDKSILVYFTPRGGEPGFYLVDDKKGGLQRLGKGCLTSDGHPQFSNDKKYVLLDTYPDRLRNQYLKIYDVSNSAQTILLKKRIPFDYRYSRRCDYHPRFNRDSSSICFDAVINNTRSICIVPVRLDTSL